MIRFFGIIFETVAYFELMVSRAYIALTVIFTCWWIGIGFIGSIMTILSGYKSPEYRFISNSVISVLSNFIMQDGQESSFAFRWNYFEYCSFFMIVVFAVGFKIMAQALASAVFLEESRKLSNT